MKRIRLVLTIVFHLITIIVYPQTIIIQGQVTDKQGNNLVAVNAYLLHQNTTGTVTDLDGKFALKISDPNLLKNESLVFSFISYNSAKINLDSVNYTVPLKITLTENTQLLNEVVVEGCKSISREFSIKEMDKLKIYLSPLASSDPLKAVAMLPSSTNTSETANPELRGSTANRTKVFLNGVPVSNPVRNSQINGIGYFSLFNPEILKNMLVYPSNPPLIYGNTSAGMIDIQTEDKIESNNYQISASLASLGICASQKINEKSFIQLYGNLMFSAGYLMINPELNKQLKSFNSNDAGLNWHNEVSKSLTLNFYNYFVSESSDVMLNLFTWQDNAKARTLRDFSVLNLKFQRNGNYLTLNVGTNLSRSRFSFGNINSIGDQQQAFFSFNYKRLFSENFSLQTGLSNEYGQFHFESRVPVFYYAMSPDSPSFQADTTMKNNLPEAYLYLRWKPAKKVIWSFGARKNIPFNQKYDPNYLSMQTNLRYNIQNDHSLLFSVGNYNNITEPNYTLSEFRLFSARQIAVEYLYEAKKTNINIAAYYKSETGDITGKRNIKGIEIYLEHYITRTLKASISNTILSSDIDLNDRVYNTGSNAGYFFVTTLSYFNPKFVNLSVAWSTRQGKQYAPVSGSIYNPDIDFYEPLYSGNENSKRFGNYNTVNLSLNKMYSIHRSNLVAFVSIFNLLDTKNPKSINYNRDYSSGTSGYFQRRSVYFGFALSFK